MNSEKIIAIILALFLPPLAVFMREGAGSALCINIVLCCFIWFPAILHALYVVLKD
ncbi:DEHA2D17160p [Debaryomyces hansenii CBS767]|uniref:DEHA2D17160p n=1 Tax=Debaryomyces hansenii (strain ATCC 36239 / CBS 767 / BCRC 21394 / JCM 1990 / NBRC 0083 / IGC 2968) TaxID=284592 RepID=Q6BRD9_DEBHA|nr:DEHA2D17160p [Debaryomyces hansenii CBS767]CAG87403.1 DEHA2D17160p [Debaryomyces hansenii CBS767]|eukprot:XP_459231.1 DEHA2D17160p [Debaryomyces hansenii CBS767]